jgi:hypothetical protein
MVRLSRHTNGVREAHATKSLTQEFIAASTGHSFGHAADPASVAVTAIPFLSASWRRPLWMALKMRSSNREAPA